jgi:hypothetical protein
VSTEILHATLHLWISGSGARFAHQTREALLGGAIEQLAELRGSILLTAECEADAGHEPRRRAELRRDLEQLRRSYRARIDSIAMSFGVDAAMKAKEKVERTVTLAPPVVAAPAGETELGAQAAEDVSHL